MKYQDIVVLRPINMSTNRRSFLFGATATALSAQTKKKIVRLSSAQVTAGGRILKS
jgi:hypothetical protein